MAGSPLDASLGRLAIEQVTPERLDPGVDQVADVRDALAADAADLLVGEPVLKLEPQDLPLIGRQGLEQLQDALPQLPALGHLDGGRVGAQATMHLLLA